MRSIVRSFLHTCWLFVVVLLFGGSLQAAEPAWITVAGPRCPLDPQGIHASGAAEQGRRPDRGSGPFRAAGQWTSGPATP